MRWEAESWNVRRGTGIVVGEYGDCVGRVGGQRTVASSRVCRCGFGGNFLMVAGYGRTRI